MRKAAAARPIVKSFSAVPTAAGKGGRWVLVQIPFDSVKVWCTRGHLRVKGEINGYTFRTSLFPTGDGRHIMMISKQVRKAARVVVGTAARFRVEPDLEERAVPMPAELERLLRQSKRLKKFYEALTPHYRNYMTGWVAAARHAETRQRRAERFAEQLMETMEAEVELPPILRLAFARNPEAHGVWLQTTRSRRRTILLGIFQASTLDGRLRRIERFIAGITQRSA